MTNKYFKNVQQLQLSGECKLKLIWGFHPQTIRTASKKKANTNIAADAGKEGKRPSVASSHAYRSTNWYNHCGNQCGCFQKAKNRTDT